MAMDLSKNYRSDAGELLTDVGTRFKKLTMNLTFMPPADRAVLTDIFRGNGVAVPLFLSLFANDLDTTLERDHSIYGKLSQTSAIVLAMVSAFSSQIDIEQV